MLEQIKKETKIVSQIAELKAQIKNWKKEGKVIGLVPTMGALHQGHESLIKKATESCDVVVVSVFVNPIQFGPNEDLDKYPRQLSKDKELCEKHGVNIIFNPTAEEMYGKGNTLNHNLTIVTAPSNLKNKLCGKTRVGHFDGVLTVVLKLFNIVTPDKAFFGQKDAQQLIIIKKMVKDLNLNLTIVPCPIIREGSGLARSSRNAYLSNEDKSKALTISKTLNKIKELYQSGNTSKQNVVNEAIKTLDQDIQVEYLDVYDIETLEPVEIIRENVLIATAARVNNVRLIDNIII